MPRLSSKVLHICKYYHDSKVHSNFIGSFSKQHGLDTSIYVADHRTKAKTPEVIYFLYGKLLKSFLILRTICAYFYLVKKSNVNEFKFVVAHTWVVDGLIALLINFFYGKPYFLQVRNTDLNFYYKYFFIYRPLFKLILKRATQVTFVSHSNKSQFLKATKLHEYEYKLDVWPNGVDSYWLENQVKKVDASAIENRILFVGRFNNNKNLLTVYQSLLSLRAKGFNYNLTLVGGSADDFNLLTSDDSVELGWIEIIPKLEKEGLIKLYRSSLCLVVPSIYETFGLVYIEALSQSCPVIYSRDQAIDGFFESDLCIAVSPLNIPDIEDAIIKLSSLQHSFNCSLAQFDWDNVGLLVNSKVSSCLKNC
jgi:glycosyltransferase involved in cell wall biosynthesis